MVHQLWVAPDQATLPAIQFHVPGSLDELSTVAGVAVNSFTTCDTVLTVKSGSFVAMIDVIPYIPQRKVTVRLDVQGHATLPPPVVIAPPLPVSPNMTFSLAVRYPAGILQCCCITCVPEMCTPFQCGEPEVTITKGLPGSPEPGYHQVVLRTLFNTPQGPVTSGNTTVAFVLREPGVDMPPPVITPLVVAANNQDPTSTFKVSATATPYDANHAFRVECQLHSLSRTNETAWTPCGFPPIFGTGPLAGGLYVLNARQAVGNGSAIYASPPAQFTWDVAPLEDLPAPSLLSPLPATAYEPADGVALKVASAGIVTPWTLRCWHNGVAVPAETCMQAVESAAGMVPPPLVNRTHTFRFQYLHTHADGSEREDTTPSPVSSFSVEVLPNPSLPAFTTKPTSLTRQTTATFTVSMPLLNGEPCPTSRCSFVSMAPSAAVSCSSGAMVSGVVTVQCSDVPSGAHTFAITVVDAGAVPGASVAATKTLKYAGSAVPSPLSHSLVVVCGCAGMHGSAQMLWLRSLTKQRR